MPVFTIRRAQPHDAALILTLLTELAAYEKLLPKFTTTEALITRDFFGTQPLAFCDIAYEGDTPVGLVTWYWTYATFVATRGLYLEDLFVRPDWRGRGYGKALLKHLATLAVAEKALRLEWKVLTWNAPSIAFYKSIGAREDADWFIYRLEGAAMQALGSP